MPYAWDDDDRWQVRITENDFPAFEKPYLGNGVLGVKFDRLVVGTGPEPLTSFSRAIYDDGAQLRLPAWNHVSLRIGGVSYEPEEGRHRVEQVLDLRTGLVRSTDEWEYRDGRRVSVTVEMFVPRTLGLASYQSVAVDGLDGPAEITFGLRGTGLPDVYRMAFTREGDDTVVGSYLTAHDATAVAQVLRWQSTGLHVTAVDTTADRIDVGARTEGRAARLQLFHAASVGAAPEAATRDAVDAAARLVELGRDEALRISAAEWKRLWRSGLAFTCGDDAREKQVLVHQFHLLSSLEVSDQPLGPLGLANDGWGGVQFWDADLWVFRAILPLWPQFARGIVEYRRNTLGRARELARVNGYRGAWYPWMADEQGRNRTPATYNDELHVNVWVALAAWEYYAHTGDEDFLRGTAWPILREISDFFVSRVEPGWWDGLLHLNCVLGPDEAVAECGQMRVNDNFTTNWGVKVLLRRTGEAAAILGEAPEPAWGETASRLYLPEPSPAGIFPEYRGYTEHGIKQADLVLAFYPLGYAADAETIRRNISYYRDKQMHYGPMMSVQVESCLLFQLGDAALAMKRLFSYVGEFVRGPHSIPFETRDYDNKSFMLTGIGGELQALIYGHYGAQIGDSGGLPLLGAYIPEG